MITCDSFTTIAAALIEGMHEEPLWCTFLDRIVSETKASVATLSFHPPGWIQGEGLMLASGGVSPESVKASHQRYGYPDSNVSHLRMIEGQPYTLADLESWDMDEYKAFFAENARLGITDARQMRVQEQGGVDGWLTIVMMGGTFDAEADELLRLLAPLLRGALGNYVRAEQDRFASRMAEDAVRRLQFGWIALDADARIASADRFGDAVLATSGVLSRDGQGFLKVLPTKKQREFDAVFSAMVCNAASPPRAMPLRSDPWLDMLLVRARDRPLSASGKTEIIVYVHGDNWTSRDREGQLADLFSLTQSEAKLALALCRGKSIAEAAVEIGVTEQSARTYSKSIFAKTGSRGQPDLVRIIMGSVIAMAPGT